MRNTKASHLITVRGTQYRWRATAMAKAVVMLIVLLTNACTTTRMPQQDMSAAQPKTIIWTSFDHDESFRNSNEDRRNWLDFKSRPNEVFDRSGPGALPL
jgi:hypothetical protein